MPTIEFKRPVKIGGKEYKVGKHEVDEKFLEHWMVKGLINEGKASVVVKTATKSAAKTSAKKA